MKLRTNPPVGLVALILLSTLFSSPGFAIELTPCGGSGTTQSRIKDCLKKNPEYSEKKTLSGTSILLVSARIDGADWFDKHSGLVWYWPLKPFQWQGFRFNEALSACPQVIVGSHLITYDEMMDAFDRGFTQRMGCGNNIFECHDSGLMYVNPLGGGERPYIWVNRTQADPSVRWYFSARTNFNGAGYGSIKAARPDDHFAAICVGPEVR